MAAGPRWRWVRWCYVAVAVTYTASSAAAFARGRRVGLEAALAVTFAVFAVLAFVRPPRWMR